MRISNIVISIFDNCFILFVLALSTYDCILISDAFCLVSSDADDFIHGRTPLLAAEPAESAIATNAILHDLNAHLPAMPGRPESIQYAVRYMHTIRQ